MNKRLREYLESIGLATGADEQAAREFYAALTGTRQIIANLLNHDEEDAEARTSCDVGIRGLGFDPENPSQMLSTGGEGGSIATDTDPGEGGVGQRSGTDGASTGGDLESAARRAMRQERERIDRINALAETAGASDELRQRAIDRELTPDEASGLFLGEMRTRRTGVDADLSGGNVGIHSRGGQTSADALAAVLMMDRCGINDPTQHIREFREDTNTFTRALDADDRSERAVAERLRWERASDEAAQLRGLSMCDIMHRAMELVGVRCQPTKHAVIAALRRNRSALANSTFSGIFTQAFGAAMLEAFDRYPDSTPAWTTDTNVPNYFEQERVLPTRGPELTKQGRGGVAEMADYGDETSKLKVDRFSQQWVTDDMDVQNDTFGGTNGFGPDQLGAAARQMRPNLAYGELLANPVMPYDNEQLFSVAHGNTDAGLLTKENLQTLIDMITLQTERGTLIDQRAQAILVAATKRFALAEYLQPVAMLAAGGGASAERLPSYNALSSENLTPLHDARLDTGVLHPDTKQFQAPAASSTYAMGRPDGKGAVFAYLTGSSQSPETTTEMLTGGMFGIRHIVQLSIGFRFLRHEPFARLTG